MAAEAGSPLTFGQHAACPSDLAHPPNNLGAAANEQQIFPQTRGRRRMFRKNEQLLNAMMVGVVTLTATLAVAFTVLQCFKAMATDNRPSSSLRRLSEADRDNCRSRNSNGGTQPQLIYMIRGKPWVTVLETSFRLAHWAIYCEQEQVLA
ncbi:hypothetical protein Esti_001112 [Eimeria stiedai]